MDNNKNTSLKTAFISVSDKSEIINLAKFLIEKNIKIISTDGTSQILEKHNITTERVSHYTNFPEIIKGRIKTIHPKIYGGILGNRETDLKIMKNYGILPIDIVVVNLYPFIVESKKIENTLDTIIEYIDIGGVSLIRAAAKNYKDVIIITHPSDYSEIIKIIDLNPTCFPINKKLSLAQKAFAYTSQYDQAIYNYLSSQNLEYKPKKKLLANQLNFNLTKELDLRYGENPHQQSSVYTNDINNNCLISKSKKIQGKELSYNNILDLDTAWECVSIFNKPACVIVKHTNPCGVCESDSALQSYILAYQCDPISAFGGVIAFNCTINSILAKTILKQQFVEVIIAPIITDSALMIFKQKKNIRILTYNKFDNDLKNSNLEIKTLNGGGFLIQEKDFNDIHYNDQNWKIVSNRKPNLKEKLEALFAWKIVKFIKSNAIVITKDSKTIGIGSGQTSRIFSTKIAFLKAKEQDFITKGATMASDAFFTFSDNIEQAAKMGINCIVQPGGSIKDSEIIAVANKNKIIMIFTHTRHFIH